jgi:hypothetical protein
MAHTKLPEGIPGILGPMALSLRTIREVDSPGEVIL